ncbi:MAG: hypothetical protein A3F09_05550 [Chlamydiae bacterium RIFCSPHIGHO2_12_FULL_49_11]|nr:MAG: hypothetical protein A3F09_05550 [Chlamydiae bacterium RIFCSPHIGHO2_12_FULL_49_11]
MKFLLLSLAVLLIFSCGTPRSNTTVTKVAAHKEHVVVRRDMPAPPLVLVDAGHGGNDTGAKTSYIQEKKVCLKTAVYVRRFLTQMGYKVIMTRARDEFIPLRDRSKLANRTRADLFVSIHYNSAPNKDAAGIEIYIPKDGTKERKGRSRQLAELVLKKMSAYTHAHSRGIKEANFHVIRDSTMPAILVEGGFISNERESHKLLDDQYIELLSLAVAEGVDHYFQSI